MRAKKRRPSGLFIDQKDVFVLQKLARATYEKTPLSSLIHRTMQRLYASGFRSVKRVSFLGPIIDQEAGRIPPS